MTTTAPSAMRQSPWGTIQTVETIATGIRFVSTAGHGGFWLSPERVAQVRPEWRKYAARWSNGWGDHWYEEDCAAYAVVATFPDELGVDQQDAAHATDRITYWIEQDEEDQP